MGKIIKFKRTKPRNLMPYIDFEKGWKFTESDKDFLLDYYNDYLECLIEDYEGDFTEEVEKIINSINANGVELSKDLIQEDARNMSEAVMDEIYDYYEKSGNILKLIENSILDVRW